MSKQIPVEVGFTFYYTDKRLKYTSKDFGIKSIPYGEGDDAEADALPAYEDELSLVNDVLRKAEKSFNDEPITGVKEINVESISDECDMDWEWRCSNCNVNLSERYDDLDINTFEELGLSYCPNCRCRIINTDM